MRLADLRKLAIKNQLRIRFALANGMECVVTEHGIAQVPGLAAIPDFNLEDSLGAARQFTIESTDGKKASPPRNVTREQLAAMTSAGGPEAPVHDHDDE